MNADALLPLALAALLYALVSGRGFGAWISVPMAFTGLGLLLGDIGLGWIELGVSSAAPNDLAEITLVLTLFGDASTNPPAERAVPDPGVACGAR